MERATWPDERVLKTTLAELPALAAAAQLRSPTLLVVGQVAALAQARGRGMTEWPPAMRRLECRRGTG